MRILFTAAVVGALALTGCRERQSQVQTEQRDVAEARREANAAIADARQGAAEEKAQIDSNLREEVADARQGLAEEQREARQSEHQGDELGASGTLTGILSNASSESVTIEDEAGHTHELRAHPATRVLVNGRAAQLENVEEGSEVRASYATHGVEHVVNELTVTTTQNEKENLRRDVE